MMEPWQLIWQDTQRAPQEHLQPTFCVTPESPGKAKEQKGREGKALRWNSDVLRKVSPAHPQVVSHNTNRMLRWGNVKRNLKDLEIFIGPYSDFA